MHVLIVACDPDLGDIWARHIRKSGAEVTNAPNQGDAIDVLSSEPIDVIVIDVVLTSGSALAIADFASYRRPDAKVVFVSGGHFFSDGSLFAHVPNACAVVSDRVNPDDLGAMVEYHGRSSTGASYPAAAEPPQTVFRLKSPKVQN